MEHGKREKRNREPGAVFLHTNKEVSVISFPGNPLQFISSKLMSKAPEKTIFYRRVLEKSLVFFVRTLQSLNLIRSTHHPERQSIQFFSRERLEKCQSIHISVLQVLFASLFLYPGIFLSAQNYTPEPIALSYNQRPVIKYSIRGKESYLPQVRGIFSQYGFIESNQKADYILELSKSSFRVLKSKGDIPLNRFEPTEESYKELHSLLDAESGYTELVSLRNNGSPEHKISDIFSKAEVGKEGARVGENIELEYVYRSKAKKEGYLTIYLFTTDGTVVQVFPNKFEPENRLTPNENYKFPSPNAKKSYKLEASPPVGNDRLLLIVTPKPLILNQALIKNYGHLIVLEKNIFEQLKQKKEEITSFSSYHLQEVVLDIRE